MTSVAKTTLLIALRRRRSGFSTALTTIIMITAVSMLGSVALIWANSNIGANQRQTAELYENNSNKMRETLTIEDVWLSNNPANYVNVTLRNVGDIALKIKEIKMVVLDSAGAEIQPCGNPPYCNRTVTAPYNPGSGDGLLEIDQTLKIAVDNIGWNYTGSVSLEITVTTERGSVEKLVWDSQGSIQPLPAAVFSTLQTNTCSIASGQSVVNCTISPSLTDTTKTFMIFQATTTGNAPRDMLVRCNLASTTTITCERVSTGGTVNIRWYIVEFSSGVTVQHLVLWCYQDLNPDETIMDYQIQPVDVTKSFILLSALRHHPNMDGDDIRETKFLDSTHFRIQFAPEDTCQETGPPEITGKPQNSAQIVQYNGASVTRGVVPLMTALSEPVTGLSAVDTAKTILLSSWRTDPDVDNFPGIQYQICGHMVLSNITSATSLQFSRLCIDTSYTPIDEIAWERIAFNDGTSVQQVMVTMPDNALTATYPINLVNQSRTIAFAGSQWSGGQALGESVYNADDKIGVMTARFWIDCTPAPPAPPTSCNLQATRDYTDASNQDLARWSVYVVEFP